MPVHLELTTGEAHDNRLVTELLSDLKSGAMLLADRGYDADWIRAFAGEHGAWANIPPKRNRKDPICLAHFSTGRAIWWSASSTGSSNAGASLPGMTNSLQTTLPS
jgi:transposase